MPENRQYRNLRVIYLAMSTSGNIICRWKDGPISGKDDYMNEANSLIAELAQGDPSGPGTGTGLAYMEYHKPTRKLYYLAMDGWSFTGDGFRFVAGKLGGAQTNDTYSATEFLDFDRPAQGLTQLNGNYNNGKPVGTIQKYGFDLIVKTQDGIEIVIDPGEGDDGSDGNG